jgi:hypothetical protein
MHFFVNVYCGLKSCIFLLENLCLRVATRSVRDFLNFCVCPSNKHRPAAKVVRKDLDIHVFAIGGVSLGHVLQCSTYNC